MVIKKYMTILLFCITFILSACNLGKEDTQEYSGIISDGNVMGYSYSVTKEDNTFFWKIGYKGDMTTIEESIDNKEELQSFMTAVSDSKLILSQLIISLLYFLIVAVISFVLYKKNRKLLKDGAIAIILASIIALYIAINASVDLSIALQDLKLHYLRLIN